MKKTSDFPRAGSPLEMLSGLGIRISHQRVVILQYLLDHDTHPSVDRIYRDLSPTMAGLSRTTVYNTMKLFVEKGLVDELSIEGGESRYDLHDTAHGHFKCRICGRIYDVPIPARKILHLPLPDNFHVEEQHIYLRGVCADCSRANSNSGE